MKKLENEYRQLMQNETPDLWSRIEAGIDAKIAEDGKAEAKYNDDGNDAWAAVVIENKKRKVINWKKYSLPLVACIAAIMCVPLLLTGFIRMASGGNAETADCAAADCAVENYATMEETTAVTTDDCAEVVTEEFGDEEIDDAYDEPAAAIETDESVAMAESQLANEPERMQDGEIASGTIDDYKQDKQEVNGSMQTLTVIKIRQEADKTDGGGEKGRVYYLNTEEVGECTLYVPEDVEFSSDMEEQLKLWVKASDEEYDFVLVEIIE